MGKGKQGGRIRALGFARQIRSFRQTTTRVPVSIGVAVLVMTATPLWGPPSRVSPAVKLSADSTVLIVCGTSCPRPDEYWVEAVMNQFITPTHPGQTITPVAVTTPEEFWPLTGLLRVVGFALGDPKLWGPGGPGWPNEPWWKLSGLFDLTIDQSVQAGVADLEAAMAAHGNDHLVINGYSQGAAVVNAEKQMLAAQYPAGTEAPDIDFVLGGDGNLSNGGIAARFPGLYIPILNWTFNGSEPTDTQFDTVVINQQYDGFADFPLYPLNVIADLNALLGAFYVHTHPFDVSLPTDPTTSPAYQGTHGDSSYYFFENENLPLFGPLRTLGVPEAVIDVVEPFFRVIVELGYDRTIPPWEPTPARLLPTTLDLAKVTTDLVNAVGEGVTNAAALFGASAPPSVSAPVTLAAPADEVAGTDISRQGRLTDPVPPAAPTGTQASTSAVTGTAQADEVSSGLTTASVPSASVVASTSERVKPTLRPATPRPVVRDSLGATGQPRGLPRRSTGQLTSTLGTTAAAPATAVGSSSDPSAPAASSSAASSSSAGNSSGGDAGGSN